MIVNGLSRNVYVYCGVWV